MKFQVQTGGRLQAVAHDGKPLGGESSFHFTFFRATVSSLDGKTLFTKVQASSENSKSETRLLQMRKLMAQAMQGGVDYHFRLMVPRLHDKEATAVVPIEEVGGMATRVRAPDGQELPFMTMKDVRAAWHHLATTATRPPPAAPPPAAAVVAPPPQPPPAAQASMRPTDPVASVFMSEPPPTTFDPLPSALPPSPTEAHPEPEAKPEPSGASVASAAAEPEAKPERRLRPRRSKRPRYA